MCYSVYTGKSQFMGDSENVIMASVTGKIVCREQELDKTNYKQE